MRAFRQLGQRSQRILQELRTSNERIKAADADLRPMRDAPAPLPGRYLRLPAPQVSDELAEYIERIAANGA